MAKKVLLVGGVAGGASAAARLRRLDETAEIIMFERDEHISFANCGLPYYIGQNIKERSKLLVQTPQSMQERFAIDVRIHSDVTSINPDRKTVTVNSKDRGIYEESYDYLVLSPGAKAIRPSIPGIDSDKIFTLRNIPDTDTIKSFIEKQEVKQAVVIGGGFIGVEMAENLKDRGLEVTLVEAAPHILPPFDTDMAVIVEKELEDNNVKLLLNDGVKSFADKGSTIEVILNSGKILTADTVILAIGVTPDTRFLKDSGIELGVKGHILVNEKLETSCPGVYALGDAIEVVDFVTKQNVAIPLAGPANKQGRIAADNIAGLTSTYKGTQGTSILKVFGLTAASTGSNERTLKRLTIPYKVIYVHPVSHASYYPGALPLSLKLIFNEEGTILGAQGVGSDGVDKRIDVIATVIRLKGKVSDLTELELCYAPPFSSAKDPVNMAGYVAENVLAGRVETFIYEELENYNKEETQLVDVRTEFEFENGHLEGAINLPVDKLRQKLDNLDKNKPILAYCQVGLRGYIAARILTQHGFNVKNMTGGYKSASALRFKPDTTAAVSKKKSSIDTDTQLIKEAKFQTKDYDKLLDASGLSCPGPLMQVKASIDGMANGQILKVVVSDPGFYEDSKAWCLRTKNELLDIKKEQSQIIAYIKKGSDPKITNQSLSNLPMKDNKTIVVFSGDLDKAMAAFIIANGAASMGKKVTLFFTFWGLNILRKSENVSVKKGFIDKMFGLMMPKGSKELKLSNMNMMGMGSKMMRMVMKNKNVSSLEELIQAALASGIEIVACQMSMDVMGLQPEELIDGIKYGGVGYYLNEAEDSNVNLFI
ncbi:Coenzyme A disulfide reductase [Sporomusa ovata DSM 2662]|uniref:CoA-disulfide reductase / Disulfide bond regulator n=1 Tax=Sporomusa ovata TaxID=2378 RepID=A0A0U1L1S1_9FIRM|nr:CoA-disulfide reductase [Sporomusa ovata]EQB25077.1 FAD-dependent pyridine nucleotide-disulfide oxidoreductase [Sporomusa ovata DSM 2662]CQR73626.1 CoA-disulfide reductase / Disulfide bond regulator [Sporomusa ovata]